MEALEEAVLDQSQVVTYKWVCHKLGTTANAAKHLLFAFAEAQKKLGTNLEVIYLVAGMKKADSSVHAVSIVPFSKLQEVKSRYSFVSSVHVYSVHKSPIRDNDVLYSVDCDLASTLDVKRASAIVCAASKFRSDTFVADETDHSSGQRLVPKDDEEVKEAKPSSVIVKPKENRRNNISSMFSTMASKKRTAVTNVDPTSKEVATKDEKTATQKATKASCVFDVPISKQKVAVKTTEVLDSKVREDEAKKRNTKGHDKRKKNIDKTDPPKKRRKRIIEISDSSEEDEVGNDRRVGDSESPIPRWRKLKLEDESDEASEVSRPASRLQSKENDTDGGVEHGRRRRGRRLIEETVQDEDGYLSTQKKWVECSDGEVSDDENAKKRISSTDIQETKVETETETATAKSRKVVVTRQEPPPLKNKQATLTSFFKRK